MVRAKLLFFQINDTHQELSDYLDLAGKFETTEESEIKIKEIHFDGYEHHQRHYNADVLREKLKSERDFRLSQKLSIDDRLSDHSEESSQSYSDCQILQMVDVLVGSCRYIFSDEKDTVLEKITKPLRGLFKRFSKGRARMQNSRNRNSILLANVI